MTALRTLIEAVERGRGWDTVSGTTVAKVVGLDNVIQFRDALNGSVDAALAMKEAVLPGWDWNLDNWSGAAVHPPESGDWIFGNADTPARALLLAILKAMEVTTAGKE